MNKTRFVPSVVMSNLRGVTALACVIGFAACESPTMPGAATPEFTASVEGPRSTGAPTIDRQFIDVSFIFSCGTFDAQQHIDARIDSRSWVNDDGSTRSNAHLQGRITFTNLATGLVLTNDVAFNEEVLVSADGLFVEIRTSGVQLKVRREAKGRQIVYEIGRSTLTLDFSTVPPTVEASFNGRADDPFGGPCAALAAA